MCCEHISPKISGSNKPKKKQPASGEISPQFVAKNKPNLAEKRKVGNAVISS